MCGQQNKIMSVQETIEELKEVCIDLRRSVESVDDPKGKEKIVLKHIKEFSDTGLQVNDFQKGYLSKSSFYLPSFQ